MLVMVTVKHLNTSAQWEVGWPTCFSVNDLYASNTKMLLSQKQKFVTNLTLIYFPNVQRNGDSQEYDP